MAQLFSLGHFAPHLYFMPQDESIEDMEKFIKEINNHGKTSQHNLWNMTGTIFGIFLTGISVIATLKPESNKLIIFGSMAGAIIGMFCVWRCFHLQTQFYAKVSRFGNDAIQAQGQASNEEQIIKEGNKLITQTVCADKLSKICMIVTALGLVLTIIM